MAAALLGLALLLTPQGPSGPAPASLAGRVIDGDSRTPIAGARVIAIAGGSREEVVTDRAGRFLFARLAAGRYRVLAEKTGYVTNPVAAGIMTTLTGPAQGLDLPLYQAGVIAGEIVDERGNPVAGAWVHALRKAAATGTAGSQGPPALTNDLGEFRVASLMAGEYVVMATPRGVPRGATTLIPTYYLSTSDPQAAFIVTLSPGETVVGVSVTMLSAPGYEISGIVVDEQGRPQAGATVTIIVQQMQGQMSAQASMRGSTTAQDGRFRVTGLPPGSYRLTAASRPPGSSASQPALESIFVGLLSTVAGKGPFVSVEIRDENLSGVTLVLPTSR